MKANKNKWGSIEKTSWSFKGFKTWCDVQQLAMKNIILKDQLNEETKIEIDNIKK